MAEVVLVTSGFFGMMVLLTSVLHYELEMSVFISGMLSISVMSVSFMVAVALQYLAGFSMLISTGILALAVVVGVLAYEAFG